jgi:hypothetical protein
MQKRPRMLRAVLCLFFVLQSPGKLQIFRAESRARLKVRCRWLALTTLGRDKDRVRCVSSLGLPNAERLFDWVLPDFPRCCLPSHKQQRHGDSYGPLMTGRRVDGLWGLWRADKGSLLRR